MKLEKNIYNEIKTAVEKAINKIGIETFNKTSLFRKNQEPE